MNRGQRYGRDLRAYWAKQGVDLTLGDRVKADEPHEHRFDYALGTLCRCGKTKPGSYR